MVNPLEPAPATYQTDLTEKQGGKGFGRYMALSAALLGWMFDGAEMGVFSMVGRPALHDLMPEASEKEVALWFGVITALFLIGAATGGVLFGWLGDRVGRVRAMTLSVLVYATFTGLCGLSVSALQLGILRFIAALGMGGEWALGVALVMEVWPNRSRFFMAGLIGAAAPVGYLIVGLLGLGLAHFLEGLGTTLDNLGVPEDWIAALLRNQGWRIMLLFGTAPALLTFLIRLFVPESERWQHEHDRGATSYWATRDLIAVIIGALGPVGIIFLSTSTLAWTDSNVIILRVFGAFLGLLIATAGFLYPVLHYLRRSAAADGHGYDHWQPVLRRMLLAATLSGVALLGTWGSTQWAPAWADKLTNGQYQAKEWTQIWSSTGSVVGTLAAVVAANWLGRRTTYSLLCVLSIASLILFYQGNSSYGRMFLPTAFLMGAFTGTFYGWLPLYLPELFRTNIRATAMGFSYNFGRIFAAIGTLQVGSLFAPQVTLFGHTLVGGYPFACTIASAIYLFGIVIIRFAPETKGKPLPQ